MYLCMKLKNMVSLYLEVEENEYATLVVHLRTLRYVKLAKEEVPVVKSQMERIKETLEQMPNNLFQDMKDPLEWQRSVRGEWA